MRLKYLLQPPRPRIALGCRKREGANAWAIGKGSAQAAASDGLFPRYRRALCKH